MLELTSAEQAALGLGLAPPEVLELKRVLVRKTGAQYHILDRGKVEQLRGTVRRMLKGGYELSPSAVQRYTRLERRLTIALGD